MGGCNPGELIHSLMCAAVSVCRAFRSNCSRSGVVLQFPSLFSQPLSLLGQPLIESCNTPMLAHSPSPQEATSQLDTCLVSGTVGYPTQRVIFFAVDQQEANQPSGNERSGQACSLSLAGLGGGSLCQSQEALPDVKIGARPPEKRL